MLLNLVTHCCIHKGCVQFLTEFVEVLALWLSFLAWSSSFYVTSPLSLSQRTFSFFAWIPWNNLGTCCFVLICLSELEKKRKRKRKRAKMKTEKHLSFFLFLRGTLKHLFLCSWKTVGFFEILRGEIKAPLFVFMKNEKNLGVGRVSHGRTRRAFR